MKPLLFITILSAAWMVTQAQSVEEANRYLYYNRYQTAEKIFHQVLDQHPDNAEAWYGLTKLYLLQHKIDKANDTIQLAPESVRSDPYFKVAYGTILLEQNKKNEASGNFNRALEQTKQKNPAILAAVAEAHIRAKAGDNSYAIDLLNRAAQKDKRNPALLVLLGDAYRKLANGSEAYKAYYNAIYLNEKYAFAYYRLGELFLAQKSPDLYVDFFKKAIAADPDFSPAIRRLYVYEFYHDPSKAMEYYRAYIPKSDSTIENQYDLADLLYLNKKYDEAIEKAGTIIQVEGKVTQPRLYKLIAYSYAEKKDTAKAIDYMKRYFAKEADSNIIARDYLSMAEFYTTLPEQDSLVTVFYTRAARVEKDSSVLFSYYEKLADRAKDKKDYAAEANWLGKYYIDNNRATNRDLFNWAFAYYRAKDYPMADSVFGMYAAKYPEQGYGYYWQAKSKALQDTSMEKGFAVPVYKKLVEVLQKDTADANYKNWMIEACGYLATYEANTEKNYTEAVNWFQKILEVDPENVDAKRYIIILEKNLKPFSGENAKSAKR